jgi:hypothetical protein
MQVLMDHNNNSHDQGAVAWLPDGKSFIVVNPDLFVKTVLNRGFKASKYASFVRKLHRWGFVRLTSGTGTDCFHHPFFALGDMEQVGQISCAPTSSQSSSGGGGRAAAAAPKASQAGLERLIRAKVAEAATKTTFHETMDMRQGSMGSSIGDSDLETTTGFMIPQHHATPGPTSSALTIVNPRNKALDNSSSNLGKGDIEWGNGVANDPYMSKKSLGDYGNASDYSDLGKRGHQGEEGDDATKESVPGRRFSNDLIVSPTGAFSPRPFPSSDTMQLKKSSGVHQQVGRFFNANHEAKPSGLEELAMVANGLREQSMQSSTSI